jgi:hypothetical protein
VESEGGREHGGGHEELEPPSTAREVAEGAIETSVVLGSQRASYSFRTPIGVHQGVSPPV